MTRYMNLIQSLSYVMRLLLLPNIAIGLVCISALLVLTVRER